MKHNLAIAALCIALFGLSGCKKPSEEAKDTSTKPEALLDANAAAGTQDDAKPADDAKPDEGSKPEADAAQPEDGSKDTAADDEADADHGMAAAQERSKLKFHTPVCPEGAKQKGDKCICPGASGKGAEGKCKLKPLEVPQSGKGFKCVPDMWECRHSVMCTLPEGCTSPDGRYYGPYYTDPVTVGGIVVSPETDKPFGECVLDRTDGLKLFSELGADKAGDFACDQEFCACANTTCIRTELCLGGKCQPDTSKLPELTPENRAALFADSLPIYIDGMPPFVFDTFTCPGGKLYCHGLDNPPMLKPEDGDFECQTVKSLPGFESGKSLKAWVCPYEDKCKCGSESCEQNQICYNGKCI